MKANYQMPNEMNVDWQFENAIYLSEGKIIGHMITQVNIHKKLLNPTFVSVAKYGAVVVSSN